MATVKQVLAAVAPEFAAIPDDLNLTILTDLASQFVKDSVWGERSTYAKALLVAHFLKVGLLHGTGAITSEKVGDLARSYATMGDHQFNQTGHGTLYLSLRRTLVIGPIVA